MDSDQTTEPVATEPEVTPEPTPEPEITATLPLSTEPLIILEVLHPAQAAQAINSGPEPTGELHESQAAQAIPA